MRSIFTLTMLLALPSLAVAQDAAQDEAQNEAQSETEPTTDAPAAEDGDDPSDEGESAAESPTPPSPPASYGGPAGSTASPQPAGSAAASPSIADNEMARMRLELATAHFAAERYAEALVELQAVRELTGSDEVLYNMGRCYEGLGRRDAAIDHYERFLAAGIRGPFREDAEARLERLKEEQREAALDAEIAEGPGAGTYVALAVAAVGLVVGGIFGALTLVEDKQLSEGCGATLSCTGDDLGDIRVYRSVADLGFVAAAIGGTAGLIALFMWMSEDEADADDESAARPLIVPFVLPGEGAGAAASVTF